jgi:molybdopterin-guanine dinucleotide biosynthesis protein A
MIQTAGIVLAGGRSSRFGSPKAFALDQGMFYYERSYAALESVCEQVVIVTLEELLDRYPNRQHVITDCALYAGQGPLAGIYSAMIELPANRYVVLPCDMPYITGAGLARLLEEAPPDARVCAVEHTGRKHPLVGCWNRSMLEPIRLALEQEQLGVVKLLDQSDAIWMDGEALFEDAHLAMRNFNRPDQIFGMKDL